VPVVLCLANYERRKGQEDLLRALAALSLPGAVQLRLHGAATEPGEKERIAALVSELGLGETVRVGGPITGADKDQALRDCAAFCLPSYDEGLPMAMLEAMSFGRPVIVTRVGSIPEVITDGRDGLLVAAGDVPALTSALARVADADPALGAMGRMGRDLVEQRYSVTASADRLLDLWTRLAGT
jgi:glycosyltransferase involved in cell wall biosynthesis